MGRILLTLAVVSSLLVSAIAQNPRPASTPPQDEDEVVRITTNLVQVDAVVTDKDGRQVTDLRPEEFEVLEDGRPQEITNFSYVSNEPASVGGANASAKTTAGGATRGGAAVVPPARVRPVKARRAVAFVVDDLGLSFEGTAYVRQYLKRFVEEQMRAGDLFAVVRTSAGVGALQQFSADKRQVLAAVERVRWWPGFRAPTGSFAQRENEAESSSKRESSVNKSKSERDADDAINDYRENLFSVGTLGALNFVVRGMREMPGRKSVVLVSENIKIFNRARRGAPVLEYLRRLADLANRASVSVYNFDAASLKPAGLSDEQSIVVPTVQGVGPNESVRGTSRNFDVELQRNELLLDGRADFYESRAGLDYLAKQTGGSSTFSLEKVLEDQRGYYLIGYRPGEETFGERDAGARFRNVLIRVKRPGLRVRHRVGFYAVPEEAARAAAPATREGQLLTALTSPFASGDLRVRLTSLFGNDEASGSFVRSLLHVDARGLKFTEEPGGFRKAVVDVLALTFGDTGKAIEEVNQIETVNVNEADYQRILRDGLFYTIKVPVKKPGAYQLRLAVRDAGSLRVGSAGEFIEVPDLARDRLALSGIVLSGRRLAGNVNSQEFDPQANPAVRRLRAGMELRYDFVIYNARLDAATARPRLQTQVRLFREGKLMYEGKPAPFETEQQSDMKRLSAGGGVKLSASAAPGEYVLQIVVTDALAPEAHRTETQWIDFEIVR